MMPIHSARLFRQYFQLFFLSPKTYRLHNMVVIDLLTKKYCTVDLFYKKKNIFQTDFFSSVKLNHTIRGGRESNFKCKQKDVRYFTPQYGFYDTPVELQRTTLMWSKGRMTFQRFHISSAGKTTVKLYVQDNGQVTTWDFFFFLTFLPSKLAILANCGSPQSFTKSVITLRINKIYLIIYTFVWARQMFVVCRY